MAGDEFALRRDMERAAQAQTALENPIIKEAFEALEASYLNAWKAAQPRDTEGREKLWQAVQVIGRVKSHLQTVVANGQLAANEIQRDMNMMSRKRFGIV